MTQPCDNEYLQLISHHKYLMITSHTCLISVAYGLMNNTFLWIIPAGVYLNSINYWRNPVCGMRRNVDIGYGLFGLFSQTMYSHNSIYVNWYLGFTCFACAMYPLSYHFYWRKQFVMSSFIHSLVHIFSNIGNICLYAGLANTNK